MFGFFLVRVFGGFFFICRAVSRRREEVIFLGGVVCLGLGGRFGGFG